MIQDELFDISKACSGKYTLHTVEGTNVQLVHYDENPNNPYPLLCIISNKDHTCIPISYSRTGIKYYDWFEKKVKYCELALRIKNKYVLHEDETWPD
jgi:hypothetical protein